jgi:regulator of sigma E protease
MDFFLIYIPSFLVLLTVLVFVHEYGHYWVARRCGVRIEVFSIGFGPELFGWTDKGKTRWKVSAIPLGGYVKMFGEGAYSGGGAGGTPMTDEDRAESFSHKSLGKRAAVVFAGPAANYLFAIIVLAGLFMTIGQPHTPATVGTVVEGSAAEAAGIRPGDEFLSIDGTEVELFRDVQRIVVLRPQQPLDIVLLRDGKKIALTVTPSASEHTDVSGNTSRIGRLGVTQRAGEYVRSGPLDAVWDAANETVNLTVDTLTAVGQIFAGQRSLEELGGPVRIGQLSGDTARHGIVPFISFMALLSVNLGLINLFPIPMLDGGHLLFYGIEALRGKPLGERAQEIGFRIGLVVVLGLMLFVTFNDLVNLPVFDFVKSLIT